MNQNTEAAINQVAKRSAERINNLYATSYMDVHMNAGPWGAKHDEDVTAVIVEEVRKVFMVMRLNKTNAGKTPRNR